MASTWYTHTVTTDIWPTACTTDRGAAITGDWSRRLTLIKVLNEAAPMIHVGLLDNGRLVLDKFAAWTCSGDKTTDAAVSGDPTGAEYTISGSAGSSVSFSGDVLEGQWTVQNLAPGLWVEITGGVLSLKQ